MKESKRAERIINHYLNGHSIDEAAKLEGVTRGYIAYISSNYNIYQSELKRGYIRPECGKLKGHEPIISLAEVKAKQARDPFTMAMRAIQNA